MQGGQSLAGERVGVIESQERSCSGWTYFSSREVQRSHRLCDDLRVKCVCVAVWMWMLIYFASSFPFLIPLLHSSSAYQRCWRGLKIRAWFREQRHTFARRIQPYWRAYRAWLRVRYMVRCQHNKDVGGMARELVAELVDAREAVAHADVFHAGDDGMRGIRDGAGGALVGRSFSGGDGEGREGGDDGGGGGGGEGGGEGGVGDWL